MTDEEAKAVGKVADAAREIAGAGRALGSWLGKIFGPAAEKFGKIADDWAEYWQYKNALTIKDRVEKLHQKRGITIPELIPLRLGIPLLQAAAMEDDPTLQEMWAGLIANATDPNRRQDAKKVFTHILSGLEPVDVSVVKYLVDNGEWDPTLEKSGKEIKIEEVAEMLGIAIEEVRLSLSNLARFGCLRFDQPGSFMVWESSATDTSPCIVSTDGEYHLTSLTMDLLKACEH